MVLARDMKLPCSIDSKYGMSIPFGSRKRITNMLSSAFGTSRATKGLLVSTVGTRWKFTCVSLNCGQM